MSAVLSDTEPFIVIWQLGLQNSVYGICDMSGR